MQKNNTYAEMKNPKPMAWTLGLGFPFKRNTPKCSSNNTSPFIDTMSITSSISHDDENDIQSDIQSIIFNEDIQILEGVRKTDTKSFVPNIQYGKVIEILSGTEFLVAARIYNGYTKVLAPTLYNFRIRLRNVPFFGIYEECAKNELTVLILNKIVLIKNGIFTADGYIESDIYNVDIYYLKQNLQNSQKTSTNNHEYLYINEIMNKYIDIIPNRKYNIKQYSQRGEDNPNSSGKGHTERVASSLLTSPEKLGSTPNSSGDLRSPSELVVRRLHVPCAPLPHQEKLSKKTSFPCNLQQLTTNSDPSYIFV